MPCSPKRKVTTHLGFSGEKRGSMKLGQTLRRYYQRKPSHSLPTHGPDVHCLSNHSQVRVKLVQK